MISLFIFLSIYIYIYYMFLLIGCLKKVVEEESAMRTSALTRSLRKIKD